jgi:tetratricopeptide (TPR) repeat protein
MKDRPRLHETVTIAALVGLIGLFSGIGRAGQPPDHPITFTRDVAPILFQQCVGCHRPEGNAPFSLLTYNDVRPRARQIASAVTSRYMPPWKPSPGYGDFVGERRLTDAQIDTIERWAREGAYEGAPADLPPPPSRTTGWQLGTPDLIVDLPEYVLPAGGKDEFRNFVVAVPGAETRYVQGLEFHPNNRSVHHANIFVDPTPASRRLDDADPLPGYRGVIPRSAVFPDGHFLGWTPGQIAPLEPKGNAWRLGPGSDLLVQLHLMQGAAPERIRPSIGLFFTNDPPTETPAMLRLGKQSLDIAEGDSAYVVSDSYVLPVDAEVLAVQPHAHYRATEVKAWALMPDASRSWLIYINRWDFNWQDQYRYVRPLSLPAGTRLILEYTFDNSPANRHNPDAPPRRVRWGQRSSDEMGDLWIQLLTHSERDLVALSAQVRQKMIREDIVGYEMEISADPASIVLHNDVAVLYLENGQPERAAAHFAEVRRLQPAVAAAAFNLATALEKIGRDNDAIEQYREAIRLDPVYPRARKRLADALLVAGNTGGAIAEYGELLRVEPNDEESLNNLGFARIQTGELPDAIASLQRALELKPTYTDAHYNLARAFSLSNRPAAARLHFRETLQLRRDWVPALTELAWLQATTSDAEVRNAGEALGLALRAVELSGHRDAAALNALAAAYAASGRFDEACKTAEAAENVAAVSAPSLVAQIRAHLNLYRASQPIVIPGR